MNTVRQLTYYYFMTTMSVGVFLGLSLYCMTTYPNLCEVSTDKIDHRLVEYLLCVTPTPGTGQHGTEFCESMSFRHSPNRNL